MARSREQIQVSFTTDTSFSSLSICLVFAPILWPEYTFSASIGSDLKMTTFLARAVSRFPSRELVFVYGTLKRGQPNYSVMTDPNHGQADFICKAVTIDKYPLVIASRYNIPYLIGEKGKGKEIMGEVYAVDKPMLHFLDDFEGHPTYYTRHQIDALAEDVDGNRVAFDEIKPWIYILQKYKPEMLQLPFHACYDSLGEHGQRYVQRCDRNDTPNATEGHTEIVDVLSAPGR